MSEMTSIAVIYGNKEAISKVKTLVQAKMARAVIIEYRDHLQIENIVPNYDFDAYREIKRTAPDTMLVSYEFHHGIGEPSICASNYNSTLVQIINPFDYENEYDEDEEDEEECEETWYQDVYDEVGGVGMTILKGIIDFNAKYLIDEIPVELFK